MAAQPRCPSQYLPDFTGQVFDHRYTLTALLGTGSYGKVYKAVDRLRLRHEPEFLAIKCMERWSDVSPQRQLQEQEVRLHKLAGYHHRTVSLHHHFVCGEYLFMVMEFAETNLFAAMVDLDLFRHNVPLIKESMNHILDGLADMHGINIFHRDIKPDNLLCNADGTNIRFTDFGLSTRRAVSKQFGCGSKGYMPPEALDPDHPDALAGYSPKANDLWAVSMVLVNFISCRLPWVAAEYHDPAYRRFIDNRDRLLRTLRLTNEANDLLKRCFDPNPQVRPTLEEFRIALNNIEQFTVDPPETVCDPGATPRPRQSHIMPDMLPLPASQLAELIAEPVSTSPDESSSSVPRPCDSTPPTSFVPSSLPSNPAPTIPPRETSKRPLGRLESKPRPTYYSPPPNPAGCAVEVPVQHLGRQPPPRPRQRRSFLKSLARNLGLRRVRGE
ncbi:Protein kinase domain-containing protein [Mycena indigotica]|uniref:Protein kinase domain-containing protein n=1 Tax=Mycena indigotica TaxID=2126181 RepID=A0A8H6W1T3_9AGAR|nr:Protein kinase domain-containing protein [Mycena indigotica]KAF7298533.1 Protein kinase domain-containing protein [Mycena indigotica]